MQGHQKRKGKQKVASTRAPVRRKKTTQTQQANAREIPAPTHEFDDYISQIQAKYAHNNFKSSVSFVEHMV
jgi:hypothetical protein